MFLINNIEPLLKHGVRMNFVVQDSSPGLFDEKVKDYGCKIFSVTPLTKSKFKFIKELKNILDNNPEIKIIHSHLNFSNLYPLLAAYKLPVKISHSHSCYEVDSLIKNLARSCWKLFLPKLATDYWACSNKSLVWMYGKYAQSERSQIIKNAIETNKFKYNSWYRKEIRDKYNLHNNYVWIHVGTFGHAKNHIFLLSLFKEYKQINNKSKLILCGDGTLRKQIEDTIMNLNLKNDVILIGSTTETEKYYSAADLMVFPSLYEGFPFSVIEAQCSGINAIVSEAVPKDCIINPNIIRCLDFSSRKWIEKILEISNEVNQRDKLYDNIENSGYNIDQEAKLLSNLYKKALDRSKNH